MSLITMSKRFLLPNKKAAKTAVIWLIFIGLAGFTYYSLFLNGEVDSLISDLRSDQTQKRLDAANSLALLGPRGRRAVPALIGVLDDGLLVQQSAVVALSQMGTPGVEGIRAALENKNPVIRANAVRALGLSDPMLGRRFSSADDQFMYPLIINALKDEDKKVRAAAAQSLWPCVKHAGKHQESVIALVGPLNDAHSSVRIAAAHSLGFIAGYGQADPSPAVEPLCKMLHAATEEEQRTALWTLERFGDAGSESIPDLIQLLSDKSYSVRREAAWTLRLMKTHTAKVFSRLQEAYAQTPAEFKVDVVHAIRLLEPLPKTAVPFLISLLNNSPKEVQMEIVWALSDLEPGAQETENPLRELLKGANETERLYVAWSLWRNVKWEGAIPILMEGLNHEDHAKREFAAASLGYIGAPAKIALAELERLASTDPNVNARATAATSAEKIKSQK